MGLFSVLDVILEEPMVEALKKVTVSEGVRDALVGHTGALAPVLELIVQYELANWQEVSRLLLMDRVEVDTVSTAYQEALKWYRTLMAKEK